MSSANLATASARAEATWSGAQLDAELQRIRNQAAADHLAQSFLGRAGHLVEPLFRPLGWDWRVSAAVIAGFRGTGGRRRRHGHDLCRRRGSRRSEPGRQAALGELAGRPPDLHVADGARPAPVPWCLQCAATIAVIRRETNSWRWPIFAWCYMTTIGYVG